MIQQVIHNHTVKNWEQICQWFATKTATLNIPIYSSYDIRDAGYKIACVDGNIYPAGFNNICPMDKEGAPEIFERYLKKHYDKKIHKIFLVTEEHTANAYYWDNVAAIRQIMESCQIQVRIGFAKPMEQNITVTSATGIQIEVGSAMADSSWFHEFGADLIVSNNDFSDPKSEWVAGIKLPINPPRELGWYQRQKSRFFKNYNQLADEFAKIAEIDPFYLRVETEEFLDFDLASDESRAQLAERVDKMIERLRIAYQARGIQQEPFVFVKNNSGTYGLAVIKVTSGKDVLEWTYKARKKMKAAKGGRDVSEVIIQEGIPSIVKADNASAEPVIYMIGCELAGGFLRTHIEKSETESLNSPGAVYKRMCVADLAVDPAGCPNENVYGWVAKLSMLAIALEAEQMKVLFPEFKKISCGK